MFWRRRKRKAQRHIERSIRFVGEQDGEPERLLKKALSVELSGDENVTRAYLSRVEYEDGAHVALCLAAPEDPSLVERIGRCFASTFAKQEHVDIVFVSPAQEMELQRVCTPFYQRNQ
jgi:SseB protein C-terminal domain